MCTIDHIKNGPEFTEKQHDTVIDANGVGDRKLATFNTMYKKILHETWRVKAASRMDHTVFA